MRKMTLALAASAAAIVASPAVAGPNLVTNGDFSTGDLSGFTASSSDGVEPGGDPSTTTVYLGVNDGYAFLNTCCDTLCSLTQAITTTPGTRYNYSFDLALTSADGAYGGGPNFYFQFGDDFYEVLTGLSAMGTTHFSGVTGPATGGSTDAIFSFSTGNGYFLLDNISLTAASVPGAVPEPATWAMMIVGFGAVGFGMRRSRRARLLTQVA